MSNAPTPNGRPERRRMPRIVEVVDVTQLTPRMVRIEFGGEGLDPGREQRNEALPTREHPRLTICEQRQRLSDTSGSMQVERRRLH